LARALACGKARTIRMACAHRRADAELTGPSGTLWTQLGREPTLEEIARANLPVAAGSRGKAAARASRLDHRS